MKKIIIYIILAVINFVVNFVIYNYSFNLQATPFLHEEQRVDSAMLMLKTTLPAYLVSAIVLTLIFYFVAKHLKGKS
jgi:riboflavin transporter FmnP